MKIAAAYGRYSSDRQSDTSIETQIEKIEQYCAMHEYELRFKNFFRHNRMQKPVNLML